MVTSLQNVRLWQRITNFQSLNFIAPEIQTLERKTLLHWTAESTSLFSCIVFTVWGLMKSFQALEDFSVVKWEEVTMCIITGSKWKKATPLCTATKHHLKLSNSLCLMFVSNKNIRLNLKSTARAAGLDYINGVLAWIPPLTTWMTLDELCKLFEL